MKTAIMENSVCIGFIVFMLTQENLNQVVDLGLFWPQQFWKYRKKSGGRGKRKKINVLTSENQSQWDQSDKRESDFFTDCDKASLVVPEDNKENTVLQRVVFFFLISC